MRISQAADPSEVALIPESGLRPGTRPESAVPPARCSGTGRSSGVRHRFWCWVRPCGSRHRERSRCRGGRMDDRSCGAGIRCTPRRRSDPRRSPLPQTFSSRSCLETVAPGCRMSASSNSYSRVVRSISTWPRRHVRGQRIEDQITHHHRLGLAIGRAAQQGMQAATNTTNENGFERKSSAPVSSASASSYSPDLAVSMRIGVATPASRRLRQTL